MKRLFTLLMVAFVAFSCEMLDGAFDSKGEGLTFAEGTETTATFKARGGSATFKFTADLDWEATASEEWITVSPDKGAAGEGEIKVKVAENDSEAERTAVIELRDKSGDTLEKITIVQRGKSAEDEEPGSEVPNNEIWYTTTDGMEFNPYDMTGFGANLIDNTYVDGKGVLHFDGDVTAIGNYAFLYCSSLTSITIPDIVTAIGADAFAGCSSLTEFKGKFASEDGRCLIIDGTLNSFAPAGVTEYTIPDSVTEIGDYAFYDCSSLTSITIPDSVTTIGVSAFCGCSSLTSVTIPDSVTAIGGSAFCGCSSLTEFKGKFASEDGRCLIIDGTLNSFAPAGVTEYTIPDSVTEIGDYAFAGCSSLESVTLPDSVTTIGYKAFAYCDSLTSVTIPDSVTTIGDWAFEDCSSLESVTIPDSVTEISMRTFNGCDSLTEFKGKFASEDGRCLIIDGTLNSFAPAGVTEYTIPDSVTEIGDGAFAYCSSLESVTIPDSVTAIGPWAFAYCNSLESVYCKPTTPPSIGNNVFENNASGRKIYVPAESVEAYKTASYYWRNYASDIVGYNFESGEVIEPTTSYNNQIWYTTTDGMELDPYKTTGFGANLIDNTYVDGKGVLLFDGDVTTIGNYAFNGCSNLTSITIPDSVTTIGWLAFAGCSSLTSITIPDSVTTIREKAFSGCSSLTSITIPDSVTAIGDRAFNGCSNLTSITIPDSVTTIGWMAFAGCSSLTSITIPDSVTTIGDYAFNSCTNLSSLDLGNGVESIGIAAFAYCYNLESVTIPDSVTTLSDAVFCGCSNIQQFEGKFASEDGLCLIVDGTLNSFAPAGVTEYTIPNSVTAIGADAFVYCSSLTSITIPDSVTAIGTWAFYGCSSLTSITIPNSVTTIGGSAFWSCSSLESVYCKPTTPPSIDYGVFDNNRKIYVPAESVEAYKTAEGWSNYASSIVGYEF